MGLNTKATGKMTYSMVMAKRHGQITQSTRGTMIKERSMEKDYMCGQTVVGTKETGWTTR